MSNNQLDETFTAIFGEIPKQDKEGILNAYNLAYEFYDSEKSTEWNVQHLQDVIVDLGKTKEEHILNTALLIIAMN